MGTYARPAALEQALEVLERGVRAGRPPVVVAGATDHYPARVGRIVDEDVLDVSALHALRGVTEVEGGWWIGALTTWTDLAESHLPPLFDGLRQAARTIGGLQIQNRATLAGNVCNASPAADGMPNLVALDAEVELSSTSGVRRMPVASFVTGNRRTQLGPDELIVGFFVPGGPPDARRKSRSTFLKLGSRAYLVISIAMVAAIIEDDGDGRISRARIAVGACSEVATRLPTLEAELVGRQLRAGVGALVKAEHLVPLSPIDDVRGSAAYRRRAAGVLVRRALEELAAGTRR
jgi:CO/xanthine dehydrogenase FAD-binding subunit